MAAKAQGWNNRSIEIINSPSKRSIERKNKDYDSQIGETAHVPRQIFIFGVSASLKPKKHADCCGITKISDFDIERLAKCTLY